MKHVDHLGREVTDPRRMWLTTTVAVDCNDDDHDVCAMYW